MASDKDSESFAGPVTLTDDGADQVGARLLARGTAVGRYIVADLIGRGGMGVVYKAFDPELNRPVALKLLSVERATDQSSQDLAVHRARLLREAQALAQLAHPNVVTVHDVGTHGDAVFMAMEYVEGPNLKDVLGDGKTDRKALLEILKAAGRGLAAAHKVGIIHRDFKPGNVIIGNDGRVRVIDFGLARGAGERDDMAVGGHDELDGQSQTEPSGSLASPERREASSGNLLVSSLTQAGAVVGTPQYMAPEQHLSLTLDAKSDQYSFCVVLFEALYGQRPFSGRSLNDLMGRITQGRVDRPEGVAVPAWLDRIAGRGLRVDPAERYASMEALLADLENDPAIARARARARLLRWAVGCAFVLMLGATVFGIWYGATSGRRMCRGGQERLAGVWDDPTRAQIRTTFAKTGRSYAQDTFERVAQGLDRYTAAWLGARRDACEATRVRGEQSDQLMDLRMRCLDRRLGEVRALTEIFARRADAEVLDRAARVTLELLPLGSCADERALLMAVPPPEDPATRRRVEEIRRQLTQVEALGKTGKYQEGLALAERARAAGTPIAYRPLQAETRYWLALLQDKVGNYAEAEVGLLAAARLAFLSGDDQLLAAALKDLIFVVGYQQARYAEAAQLIEVSGLALEKIRDEGDQRADWLNNRGIVAFNQGQDGRALEHFEAALAIREKALGPDVPKVADALNNIGIVRVLRGEYDRALADHQRALAIREKVLGPEHPDVAMSHNNLGIAFAERGDYDRALTHDARALQIWEKALGPEHPDVAESHSNNGIAYAGRGEDGPALEHFGQAIRTLERILGPGHEALSVPLAGIGWVELGRRQFAEAARRFERVLAICGNDKCRAELEGPLARARFGLALALWDSGGDRARALRLAREALAVFETLKSVPGQKVLKECEQWLRERGVKAAQPPQ